MILSRFKTLMVFVGICAFALPSYAGESIDFIDKSAFKDMRIVRTLSQHSFSQIAAIDLNNDSIDEYILADPLDGMHYQYEIIASIDKGVASLGKLKGTKLMAAYDTHHGVRNLLGFDDVKNDYEYEVYQWDAASSRFVRERDLKVGGRK